MRILKRKIKMFEQFINSFKDPNQDIKDESEEEILPEPEPTPEEDDLVDEMKKYFERKNKR